MKHNHLKVLSNSYSHHVVYAAKELKGKNHWCGPRLSQKLTRRANDSLKCTRKRNNKADKNYNINKCEINLIKQEKFQKFNQISIDFVTKPVLITISMKIL